MISSGVLERWSKIIAFTQFQQQFLYFQCIAAYLYFTGFKLNGVEYKKVGHSLADILTALAKAGMSTTEGDHFVLKQLNYQPEDYQELESEIFLISKKLPHK